MENPLASGEPKVSREASILHAPLFSSVCVSGFPSLSFKVTGTLLAMGRVAPKLLNVMMPFREFVIVL